MTDERVLVPPEEQLHRQIVPAWRKADGTPMSCNFAPTPKDEKLLSTRRGSVIDARRAFEQHHAAGLKTCGTWSFPAGATTLDVIDDQHVAGNPVGHASVDFTPLSRGEATKEGKRICLAATQTYPLDGKDASEAISRASWQGEVPAD